ncbi:dihydrodipicolinate synthase family protein [Microbacterium sp. SSW1-49]|uniref:Dihydrodipicolinate synthase family protein n=1 Tax=Microbacterium croceum TaxID=2851645 RepID=A0ABT0F9J8_9MICO|nr:dihydrodipicolinate synthase family protein [Microbacterium croceum]MCK2034737.1 dihydrodipicolinate synthase family protein [Microbacterium croceum]
MVTDVLGDRLFTAAVTPMRADESIDHTALSAMLDSDIRRGVEGLYVCGSSGEGVLLSEDERIAVAETAVTAAAGRVPVVSHVGAMSTGEAIRIAAAAKDAGVAAISMIPPLYYGYSTSDVVRHFRSVIDAVDLPFVLYNIPQFTGRDISEGGFDELLALSQVVGVKHTSRNLYGAERIIRRYPHLTLVNGFDEFYLPALSIGARGAIGTTVSLQIELFLSLRRRFARGDLEGSRAVQVRINDTVEGMVEVGVFGAAKYLGGRLSVPLGDCRAPLPALDDDGRARLDAVFARLQEHIAVTAEEDARVA